MKTLNKLTSALRIAMVCFTALLYTTKLQAQMSCPFTINNNLDCDVIVEWVVYDGTCAIIGGPTQVTVLANNAALISGASCSSGYDIRIELVDIAGVSITTAPNSPGAPISNSCFGNTSTGGSCSTLCGFGGSSSWTMNINWGTAQIQ